MTNLEELDSGSSAKPWNIGVEVRSATVSFGEVRALDSVSATYPRNRISALIGANGAGKSTLFNAICGFVMLSSGTIIVDGHKVDGMSIGDRVNAGVVRTFQSVRLLEQESVFDNIRVGCELFGHPSELVQWLGFPEARRCRQRDHDAVDNMLETLGLQELWRTAVQDLPYGVRRLVEIGRALVGNPQVVLLDEPMAGMDRVGRLELCETLQEFQSSTPRTIIVVEHDVEVVRRIGEFVVALDAGSVIAEGEADDVLNDPGVRHAYLGEQI